MYTYTLNLKYSIVFFRLNGFLQNIHVSNLNEFELDHVDFNMFRLKLEFSFSLPAIAAAGDYNINGTVMEALELWGNGPFQISGHG